MADATKLVAPGWRVQLIAEVDVARLQLHCCQTISTGTARLLQRSVKLKLHFQRPVGFLESNQQKPCMDAPIFVLSTTHMSSNSDLHANLR